ncbi:hypothetical protein psal_cds_1341 [Pandoravirus salinus]|uniref:Uncharacterized protein n=1 Tax=Pandoravirus salinus TaxID=1349410 RepID=S4VZD8_9VIRU|nr:hypothetical protein psal_cds_1341 [Pandoravirus salinus]AGO85733.1 hypothetical protein psal_cds_1341 [Pandoravirus salinus]
MRPIAASGRFKCQEPTCVFFSFWKESPWQSRRRDRHGFAVPRTDWIWGLSIEWLIARKHREPRGAKAAARGSRPDTTHAPMDNNGRSRSQTTRQPNTAPHVRPRITLDQERKIIASLSGLHPRASITRAVALRIDAIISGPPDDGDLSSPTD